MMPGLMSMAVRYFFFSRLANIEHSTFKPELLSGQLMIAVEHGTTIGDIRNPPNRVVTFTNSQVAANLHIRRQFLHIHQTNQFGRVIAESFVGLQRNAYLVTRCFPV